MADLLAGLQKGVDIVDRGVLWSGGDFVVRGDIVVRWVGGIVVRGDIVVKGLQIH